MSLKDIAKITGASISTVSRVLNCPDYQCQNKELTIKIRNVARELNYIPNPLAKELKLGKTANNKKAKIDIFLARFCELKEDTFFYEMFQYIETELRNHNCCVGNIFNVSDIYTMREKKGQHKACGLIVLGKCSVELVEDLKRQYKGIVAIDRNPTEYKIDEVICNGSGAASLAVEHLIKMGHRKIGYIGDCNMESRYAGYYECLLQHKIPFTYDYVIATSQTRQEGYNAYEVLTQKGLQPTAVFCSNDVTALGFLQAMKEKAKKKRKNAYRPSVISIDDIDEASKFSPALTTVHIPKADMAHMAVITLLDRLKEMHREYVRIDLPFRLVERETVTISIH